MKDLILFHLHAADAAKYAYAAYWSGQDVFLIREAMAALGKAAEVAGFTLTPIPADEAPAHVDAVDITAMP